jgi:hypothetical protein
MKLLLKMFFCNYFFNSNLTEKIQKYAFNMSEIKIK